jgi:biopolymer transport protein TolQ
MNFITVELATKSAQQAHEMSIIGILSQSKGMVLFILIILILSSLASVFIIIYKYFYLKNAHKQSDEFLDFFWKKRALDLAYQKASEYPYSPIAKIFIAAYKELEDIKKTGETKESDLDYISRTLRKAITTESNHLESLIPYLATIGSTAPFVGLLGTVWGIMSSFINIAAKGSASLLTVAPGIAEALIATAIGLFAAIPAVVAYNFYSDKIRVQISDMENFEKDFLNIVKRYIFSE